MEHDNAKHTILPLSKFGLMQITRERVRPAVSITTAEQCPACEGTGQINPAVLLVDDIKRDLDFIFNSQAAQKILIKAHPFVVSHLQKGIVSLLRKWSWEHKTRIKLTEDSSFHMMQYKFFDEHQEEIRLS